jgi:hypothetical protein
MRNTSAIAIAAACLLALATPAFADVNLIPNLPTGWSWPLVPRPASDATLTSVPLPLTLTGDASSTWLNSAWRNLGSTSSMAFHNYALLDGAQIIVDRSCNPLAAGAVAQGINGGPYTLPAGRHTFELRVDATNVVAETVETDNNVARQWVWAPANLAVGPRYTRAAPPNPTGGWSSIPANQAKYNNCDGLRFTTSTSWDAVYTWSNDAAVDYDLRYYTPSTGANDGFSSPLGGSLRRGRGVEAVFTKGFGTVQRSYDIGVEHSAGTGNYYAQHVTAQYVSVGDSITFSFQAEEMLKIFYLAPLFPYQLSAWLQTTPEPSVAMGWISDTNLVIGLSELTNMTATDAAGRARLDADVTTADAQCIVVFRDPDWGTGSRNCGLKIGFAQVDLEPFAPAGWHSPLVPSNVAVTAGQPMALPDTLKATVEGPLYNVAMRNSGGADGEDDTEILVTMDGRTDHTSAVYPLDAHEELALYPYVYTWQVHAGRHTLAMEVNHESTQSESTHANNHYGEQYCWGPPWVASTTFPEQPLFPPRPSGGWDLIGDGNGEVLWPNCAASRLPTAPSTVWWQGYAVRPFFWNYPQHEISLHDPLQGTKDGFGEQLAWSMAFQNYTNYVLINLNLTPRRPFDIGIIDWTDYLEDWQYSELDLWYAESQTLGTAGTLTLPPYVSDESGDILQLYEWYFPAGWWMIHADNLSEYSSIAVAFHQADEVYTRRPNDTAISPNYGEDAWLHVFVPTAGWCCVAVFQPDSDVYSDMEYQLSMYPGVSGVPDLPTLPTTTAMVGASPNPFNPQVEIAFDLAATARARLGIFDLKGALVRVLVDADLAAGHQSVTWDGRDTAGRALPSGAYVARFEAGDVRQSHKLMLVR